MTDRNTALTAARQHGMAAIDRGLLMGDGLQARLDELGAGSSGGAILKFSGNTGVWSFKDREFDYGSKFAFNVEYVEYGYVCWKDRKLIDSVLSPVFGHDAKPQEGDLPDYGPYSREGDGWKDAFRVKVRDIEDGMEYELTFSNRSGWNAMSSLVKDFGEKVRLHTEDDGSFKTPIVELSGVAFEPKGAVGKKYAPKLRILDWYSKEDMLQVIGGVDAIESTDGETEDAPAEPAKTSAVRKPTGTRRPRMVS